MFLLLPRFCTYFSLQNFKKDDKYLAPPEFFFGPPAGYSPVYSNSLIR